MQESGSGAQEGEKQASSTQSKDGAERGAGSKKSKAVEEDAKTTNPPKEGKEGLGSKDGKSAAK